MCAQFKIQSLFYVFIYFYFLLKRAKVLRADCLCAVEGKITGVFDACYAEFGFLIKAGLICKKHFFFHNRINNNKKYVTVT